MRSLFSLLTAVLLGGCGGAGSNEAFRATGEVIAFGGGDGGASHACATCHGLKGEGDGRLTPRLAGLDQGYLHRQLDDYASGRREHREMRAIVRRLSGDDRAKVAAYYASLPAPAVTLAENSTLYRKKCAACHGARGEGMGASNPPLAGQPSAYVAAQLEAWRAGKRRGDAMGRMMAVSRALTAGEIARVAAHAGAPLPPTHPPQAQATSQ